MGIKAALWTALSDQKHRMKHWLQIVAIPNAPIAEIAQDALDRLSALEDIRTRSRSPRRHQQARTLPTVTGPRYSFVRRPARTAYTKREGQGEQERQQRQQQKGNRNSGNGGEKKFADILASQADRRLSTQGALFPVSERYLQDGRRLQVGARMRGMWRLQTLQ